MKFYGGEPNVAGSMDKINPIEHGRLITDEIAQTEKPCIPEMTNSRPICHTKGRRTYGQVRRMRDGHIFKNKAQAARAAGVSKPKMRNLIENGNGWEYA